MAYLTESTLRGFAEKARHQNFSNIRKAKTEARLSIFLAHSHSDKKRVEDLIDALNGIGIAIYVDWNDTEMPRVTNRETAEKIKGKIQDNDLFMVLATPAALGSRWVPWETGIADKTKGEARVLIIPVADPSGNFAGSEYLQLYRRVIVADDGKIGVFEPNKDRGEYLDAYFRTYSA
jgi:TIR domain